MMLDKDVLSQSFGEQISNLIIGAEGENFNLPMMNMFMKIMIAYTDMLCMKAEIGEPCKL